MQMSQTFLCNWKHYTVYYILFEIQFLHQQKLKSLLKFTKELPLAFTFLSSKMREKAIL